MKLECGSGYHPHMDYDIHIDLNPNCPHLEHVCSADKIPYPDETFDEIMAADILEHFSYRDTVRVLKEWCRVLKPGGKLYVQCPDAKLIATRWVNGEISDYQASYWIMGGHNDGTFVKENDDWRFNAHYVLLSPSSLVLYLNDAGFTDYKIESDGGSNIVCWATK